jgi:N-sulfoglucosamine sulfohydrolase
MYAKLAGDETIYDYAQSAAYPLDRIIEIADLASDRNPAHLPSIQTALDDPNPVIRYWGATGCLILDKQSAPAKKKLLRLLADEWPDVRVVAAEAIAHLGEPEVAATAIAGVLTTGNLYEVLAAENALDFLRQAGLVTLAQAQEMVRNLKFKEPADRIPRYLLELQP